MLEQCVYRIALTGRNLPDVGGYFDLGGVIPAEISKSEAEACYQYAEQVCKVLGLDLGVFHVEIMITPVVPFSWKPTHARWVE